MGGSTAVMAFATDANKTADTDDDRSALATKNFTLKFDASLSAGDNSPYSEVRAGIEYENFLRKNAESRQALRRVRRDQEREGCHGS